MAVGAVDNERKDAVEAKEDDEEPEWQIEIHGLAHNGFMSFKSIEEAVIQRYTRIPPEEIRAKVAQLKRDREALEAKWPAVTDCDRLDNAFAAMNQAGILALQDFTCCPNCGWGSIARRGREQKVKPRGYAFYHNQTTDSAIERGTLYLQFIGADDRDDGIVIGQEIVRLCRDQGLQTEWNGTEEQCILIKLDWKRRAPKE